MQNARQKLQLARWRDRQWVYHPSESHADASAFRTRMRAYGKPEVAEAPQPSTLGSLLRARRKA